MDIYIIIIFSFSILVFITLVLPFINWVQIKKLRQEINELKELSAHAPPQPTQTVETVVKNAAVESVSSSWTDVAPLLQSKLKKTAVEKNNFEQQFGVRLTVWVGAVAMLLAGFFLVKYSIMAGLLTENVRVIVGGIFALILLAVGQWINQKAHIANYQRISQALIGAGIALLYICVFAATSLYHLIPTLFGFIGMMGVTALAVVLSLRHGAPIAFLGLLGGLLTPALIHSTQPNAFLLFSYLYLVLLGLFIVIRKRGWWFLILPTLLGSVLWVSFWLCDFYTPGDSMWLGLFIIAVTATFVQCTHQAHNEELSHLPLLKAFKTTDVLNYFALGTAVILMGVIGAKGGYGSMEWSLFGILAAGGVALANFDNKTYGFVPLISMLVNAVMFLGWTHANSSLFIEVILSLGLLYCISGYYFIWRTINSLAWARLAAATSLIYFVIAYYHFNSQALFLQSGVWSTIAFILAILGILAVWHVLDKFVGDSGIKQRLLAVFILVAVAFLSIGLALTLKQEFLPLAIAVEIFMLAWLSQRIEIQSLRSIIILLLAIFGLLLATQLWVFIQLSFGSVINLPSTVHPMLAIANTPLLQLGIPVALFMGASYYLSKQRADKLIDVLQMIAVGLLALMAYCLVRNALHLGINWLGIFTHFIERGVITNFFFLVALSCLWWGYAKQQKAVVTSGLIIGALAILRIIYFDLLLYNPLWMGDYVGSIPFFNGLFIAYLLPVLWIYLANQELIKNANTQYLMFSNIVSLFLVFTFISLSVRQFYQGGVLNHYSFSNPEIYTYSTVWLLLAIGLLVVGTLQHNKPIRIASLLLMLLTVGKVFLFDASALTGLYRVFSFFGLGLILIGLSWFYTRFVFIDKKSLLKE